MDKDDKFIKEKLDIATKLDRDDLEVPASLREECKAFVSSLPSAPPKRIRAKRTAFLTSCVAAVVVTGVVLCVTLIPRKGAEEKFYDDNDLVSQIATHEQIAEDYNVLTMENYWSAAFTINKDRESSRSVNVYMQYSLEYGVLEMTVALVNNYVYPNAEWFSNLATEEGSSGLFTYRYGVLPSNEWALASFEYGGYTYYLSYTSQYPEDINNIVSSLKI